MYGRVNLLTLIDWLAVIFSMSAVVSIIASEFIYRRKNREVK